MSLQKDDAVFDLKYSKEVSLYGLYGFGSYWVVLTLILIIRAGVACISDQGPSHLLVEESEGKLFYEKLPTVVYENYKNLG